MPTPPEAETPAAQLSLVRRELASWVARARRGRVRLHVPRLRGLMRVLPGQPFHLHAELFLQISGWHAFRFPEESLESGPGEACLVPRGLPHSERVRASADQPFRSLLLACPADRINYQWLIERNAWPRARFLGTMPTFQPLLPLLQDELATIAQPDASPHAREEAAQALLVAMLSLVLRTLSGEPAAAPTEPVKISQVRELVQRQLQDPRLSVATLAAEVHWSVDHLSRFFRRVTGMPLVHYINELRLTRARHLLVHSPLNVAEVALACGFEDPAYFTRLFRRRFDTTPRTLRTAPSDAAGSREVSS